MPDSYAGHDVTTLRILLLDEDRAIREGTARVLAMDGHMVQQESRAETAFAAFRLRRFDVVVVDAGIGPGEDLELIRRARDGGALVVVTTASPSLESNMAVLGAGAWEYLPKPYTAAHLQLVVGRAALLIARRRVQDPTVVSAGDGVATEGAAAPPLLGTSAALQKAVSLAAKVAATDASVMISGESGTGKELVAQYIHARSRRAARHLVPVNCAALPDNLLESEMFGYRKGAFTGADRDKAGLLEMAHRSTLFLDELTEMAMPLQAKLLRVLQDGVVRRLGSETQDAVVDVRFVSATNRDPQEAVRHGGLREDLYYRLRVVPIRLPPLRQRPEDVVVLAEHFLRQAWERHRRSGEAPRLAADTIAELQTRPWRGNVRELQNLIEHVAVLSSAGSVVTPDDLPNHDDEIMPAVSPAPLSMLHGLLEKPFHEAKDELVARFEQAYVRRITAQSRGNMSKAARLAGIDRTTLYRLLEKHGDLRARDEAEG
jgi:two-component system response regulator AtoC